MKTFGLGKCLIPAALTALFAVSCTFGRIIYHNFSGIDDYRIFPQRRMAAGSSPFRFKQNDGWRMPGRVTVENTEITDLDGFLSENDTTAFIVLRDDSRNGIRGIVEPRPGRNKACKN